MNAQNLLDSIGDAKDIYVRAAMETRNGAAMRRTIPWKKVLLIAAVIAMTLTLVGCTVAYVLRLQKLKIAEETATRNFDASGEWVGPTEVTRDVIAIRGYPGSANHQATKEWYEFAQSYDPEKKLLTENNENGIPEQYAYPYSCYTWEMVEKVDEIAEKYGLKLLSPETVVQRWQIGVMFDALGISGVCHEEKAAKVSDGAGYFYPEGNFKYEFEFYLPMEAGEQSPGVLSTMYYTKKDYFDPDYMSIDTEFFEQWDYTTADGTQILIAMSSWGGYFFAETEDAFLTVSCNLAAVFAEQEGKVRQLMEQAAEVIDFSITPEIPDMTGMEEKLAQAEEAYYAAQEAKPKQSYATYASYIQEKYIDGRDELLGTPYIRDYYALVDVTGDGQEELLLGRYDFCFNDLLYIRDGKVVAIEYWRNMNLCEDGVIRRTMYFPLDGIEDDLDHPCYYSFGQIAPREGGGKCVEAFEAVECGIETREWTWSDLETEETKPLTWEEVETLLSQYPLLDIEMKPISEFPMQ